MKPTPTRTGVQLAQEPRAPLVEEFLASYVHWREACEDVRSAYERWATGRSARTDFAFERYRAALDWEEHAARVHADRVQRIHGSAVLPQP